MANPNSFNIVGLDFSEAKASLKSFLSTQETLKDYNFDGSVLSTILDVLAYNTHYQAFYANMVANEMFLDSSVMRPSVVSHAKSLGYVPSSRKASKAILTVMVNGADSNTYLSRGSEFIGTDAAGTQYKFVLLQTVYADTTTASFKNIEVHEGTIRRMSYIYNPNKKESSILLIPNDKIDTNTIRVRVQASASDSTGISDVWSYSESYIDLTPTKKVFFLQEKEAGMYELYFGDNFLGKQPATGSLVTVEYLETNASAANGITSFSSAITGIGSIQTTSSSSGGIAEETISRIKFLAPKFYKSQNRAVTENDYIATTIKKYPNADSVFVYGGETTIPPQYGKVFIAIKPKAGTALTIPEKVSLAKSIKQDSSIVTVTPEIVDPDYIDIVIDSTVTYDPTEISIGIGTLKALIVAYMFTYSSTKLETFGYNFYLSKLAEGINGINSSILSNQTTVSMRKTVNLSTLVSSKGFVMDFANPIHHEEGETCGSVIASNTFSHINTIGTLVSDVYIEDDGNGKINLVKTEVDKSKILVYPNIGKIEYASGKLKFSTLFSPISNNPLFSVTVKPQNTDLFVFENKIMRVNRAYTDSVKVGVSTQTDRKQVIRG
ncbi:hypothetical protein FJZ55_00025 [Candidatus Woesearchaeota archaeon]|nr:hypothetical protein [Candidatus Woesearchaeota archaeon]